VRWEACLRCGKLTTRESGCCAACDLARAERAPDLELIRLYFGRRCLYCLERTEQVVCLVPGSTAPEHLAIVCPECLAKTPGIISLA
jgi:hypothetical protein